MQARTTGAILMISGRVPTTIAIFTLASGAGKLTAGGRGGGGALGGCEKCAHLARRIAQEALDPPARQQRHGLADGLQDLHLALAHALAVIEPEADLAHAH